MTDQSKTHVLIDYTNHAGVRQIREIIPQDWSGLQYGITQWHPEEQWLLNAYDVGKQAKRTFAMKDVHGWGVKPHSSGQTVDGMLATQLKRSMERNARMSNRLRLLAGRTLPMNHDVYLAAISSILKDEDPA